LCQAHLTDEERKFTTFYFRKEKCSFNCLWKKRRKMGEKRLDGASRG
jgi:hypothetical protein